MSIELEFTKVDSKKGTKMSEKKERAKEIAAFRKGETDEKREHANPTGAISQLLTGNRYKPPSGNPDAYSAGWKHSRDVRKRK